MRIECPRFKNNDGIEMYIIVGFFDYSTSENPWKIDDIFYRIPPKRKWKSLIYEMTEDYRYRALSYEDRDKMRYEKIIKFAGKDKVKEALEYAWEYVKPNIDNIKISH